MDIACAVKAVIHTSICHFDDDLCTIHITEKVRKNLQPHISQEVEMKNTTISHEKKSTYDYNQNTYGAYKK